jgi:osmotically-inducible protein OsmY
MVLLSIEFSHAAMILTGTMSDADLDRQVTQELEWNPRVGRHSIAVSVQHGIVTLGGFVDGYAKKIAAREAAHAVSGVLDVADQIQVKPEGAGKTDREISEALRQALEWDFFVPDRRIKSTVSNGWVTLEGDVDSTFQREDAARVVERLIGVRGCTNMIVVKAADIDHRAVRQAIQDALARRAEREAEAIGITVNKGNVRLTGKVQSKAEKFTVERVALHTAGVSRVENDLVVA